MVAGLPRLVRWLALAAPLACTPRAGTAERAPPLAQPPAQSCAERLPATELALPAPPELEPIGSHLGVEVRADVAALERELGKEIPVQLAAEKRRPVGAAGEVTYSVTRGRFGVRLDGERLGVTVPVGVQVEICKPLGPFCPTYGRCRAGLSAVGSVPLLLGDDYEIGKSRVSVALTQPCTIAGLDASSRIRQVASRQVGAIQRRIDQAMPRIGPTLAGAWQLLQVPVSLGSTSCLRITPQKLTQGRPTLEGGAITARLAATGELTVEEPCRSSDKPLAPRPLPKLEHGTDVPPEIRLNVPIRIAWADVSASLTRSLAPTSTATSKTSVVKVEARGVRGSGQDRVALRVTVAGPTCGDLWLLADPWWDAATSRVRLRNVGLAAGPRSALADAIAGRVEQGAAIGLPVDVSGGPNALRALVLEFARELPKTAVAEVQMQPVRVDSVRLDGHGLAPIATFAGTAQVLLQ